MSVTKHAKTPGDHGEMTQKKKSELFTRTARHPQDYVEYLGT